MTWGTTNTNEKRHNPPPYVWQGGPQTGMVSVTGNYGHLPQKSVLAVSSLIIIAGVICASLGIAYDVITHTCDASTIIGGIFFVITGTIGIVSAKKSTKGRLVAAAVLAIIACLGACSMASMVIHSMHGGSGMHSRGGRHRRDKGDDHDKKGDYGKRYGDENGMHRARLGRVLVAGHVFVLIFLALIFACTIALAVFTLRTVTSPRSGQAPPPYQTPVVAYPASKEPTHVDTYNGNDDEEKAEEKY